MISAGVEIGEIGQKIVVIDYDEGRNAILDVSWVYDRSIDSRVDRRLKQAFNILEKSTRINISEYDTISIALGNCYSFPSFEDCLYQTSNALKDLFPKDKTYIVSAESGPVPLDKMREIRGEEVLKFVGTSFIGSAHIAGKFIRDGIALDMGSSSTDILKIREGNLDLLARHHRYNRWYTRELLMLGALNTPLAYILTEITADGEDFVLLPYYGETKDVSSLLSLLDGEFATLFDDAFPSKLEAKINIAKTVGGDINVIPEDRLRKIATVVYKHMIESINRIVKSMKCDRTGITLGLGKDICTEALKKCGFRAGNIIDTRKYLSDGLWTVTSAYGLAIIALEAEIGRTLKMEEIRR
jgi:uncharacterized hydantoinase/oxoprolinase family protein